MHPIERLRAIGRYGTGDDEIAVEAAGALAGLAFDPAGMVVACRRLLSHQPAAGALWWVCAHVLAASDPAGAARDCVRRLDADPTADRLAAALPILDPDDVVAVVGSTLTVERALDERPDCCAVVVRGTGGPAGFRRRPRRWVDDDDEVPRPTARPVDRLELGALPVRVLLVPALAAGDDRAIVSPVVLDLLDDPDLDAQRWLVAPEGRILPARLLAALEAYVAAADPDEAPDTETVPVTRFDRVVTPRGALRPLDALARVDCPVPAELLRRPA